MSSKAIKASYLNFLFMQQLINYPDADSEISKDATAAAAAAKKNK